MNFKIVSSGVQTPRTQKKLASFAGLPAGWHYGRGIPINDNVISRADRVFTSMLLVGLSRTDAFPGENGEVLVTAYHHDHYVAVTIDPDGTYSFVHELNDEECCVEERVDQRKIRERLRIVAREIWGTYDWSTQSIGSDQGIDLVTWPSNLFPVLDCQYSTLPAPRQRVA